MTRLTKFLIFPRLNKNFMKMHKRGRAIILIIYIFITGNVYGQFAMQRGAASSSATGWPNRSNIKKQNSRFAAEAADLPISYFDPLARTHDWPAASNWGEFVIIAYTERITLSSDSGYLDSVSFVFDQITGDSVAVVLDPDTVLQTPVGYYHLDATAFNTSLNPFGVEVIYPSTLNGATNVTVPFPHVQVPKNFHVTLVPSESSSGFTASYYLRGDSEQTLARTADNCHSTFIGINPNTGYYEAGVIDSDLAPAGDTIPIYSNLYITAFVSSSTSSVASDMASTAFSVFPNPASTFLQVHGAEKGSCLKLLDLLGRSVLSVQINENAKLDVSNLQPGRYEAVVNSGSKVLTAPIVIQR